MKSLNRVLVSVICFIMLFTTGSILAADEADAYADGAVCYIGDSAATGKTFTSIKAAIESLGSCNRTTIHLLCDTTWDGMEINKGEDFAIDGTKPDGKYTVTLLGNVTVKTYSTRAYFTNVTIDLNKHHFVIGGNGELHLENGSVLKNGYDSSNGGGAAFAEASTIKMFEGSVVEDCSAKGNGGAFRLNGVKGFYMYGGEIRNCVSGDKGGAISAIGSESKVDLTGGKISGNTAVKGGGGVYADGASKVNASGSINISGNTLSDKATVNNMEVAAVSSLKINGEVTGNIGLTFTGATRGTEIGTVTEDVTDVSKIMYDNSDYKVALSEGKLVLTPDYVCYVGDDEAMGKKYKTLSEALSSKTGKSVTIHLISDVELPGMDIKNDTDFKIIGENPPTGKNFTVTLLGDVNIRDYSDHGTLENVTFNLNGHHISIYGNLELTLNGGAILENGNAGYGGAAFVQSGTFTMNEGSIVRNCTSTGDGGAFSLNGGKFNMNGGEITGCVAATNGGAISLARETSTVTLKGGSISGNKAKNGGGIYVLYGEKKENIVNTSGSASVAGNTITDGSTASNVAITDAAAFAVTGIQTGKIGVTVQGASEGSVLGHLTSGITFENSGTVSYDKDSYIIYIDGTELKLGVKPALTIQVDSGSYSDKTGVIRFLTTFNGISGAAVEKYGTYALATDNFDIERDKNALTKFVEFTVFPEKEKAYVVDVVDIPEDKFDTKIMGVSFIKIKGIDTPFYIPYAQCVSVNSINDKVKNLGDKVSE